MSADVELQLSMLADVVLVVNVEVSVDVDVVLVEREVLVMRECVKLKPLKQHGVVHSDVPR